MRTAKERSGESDAIREFSNLPKESQAKVLRLIKVGPENNDCELLTDSEFANVLGISVVTLRKALRSGPAKKRNPNSLDVRMCRHVMVGLRRRWPRSAVNEFVNGRN
jgi:hypothetical protein